MANHVTQTQPGGWLVVAVEWIATTTVLELINHTQYKYYGAIYDSVEKFSTLVLFSVLYHFKTTAVPLWSFQYFSTINALEICSM